MAATPTDKAKYRRLRAHGVSHKEAVAMAAATPNPDFDTPAVEPDPVIDVWVPSTLFANVTGATLLTGAATNQRVGWSMSPTATTELQAMVSVPPEWEGYQVCPVIVPGNNSGGTGDVVLRITDWAQSPLSGASNSTSVTEDITVAFDATDPKAITSATGASRVLSATSRLVEVKVARLGAAAADTFANSVLLSGVMLKKVA